MKAGLSKCDFCPSFHFKSKTEKARHLSLFHRRQRKAHVEPTHKFAVCGKAFASLASLNRHEKKINHTKQKTGVPQKSTLKPKKTSNSTGPPAKKSKTKQSTMNDMLHQGKSTRDDEDHANEDQECAAESCIISSLVNLVINWISCESCEDWYHTPVSKINLALKIN